MYITGGSEEMNILSVKVNKQDFLQKSTGSTVLFFYSDVDFWLSIKINVGFLYR